MVATKDVSMEPTVRGLNEDLTEAAKEFEEQHKKDLEKVKEMELEEYKIRGDDEEWDQVLKKAGSTAVVSIKSDKKRKWEGENVVTSNAPGKQRKEMKHGKFKKNKDKHGKFGKKA
ncbi:RNA cytidine acetyltransferase-like [Gambusia affinis]|nr:RNA cytidine acetyltransferase-like [Gambusia affinis]